MANQLSDLDRTKRAVAALVTCVVTTLNETEPSFQERFLANLDKAYCKFQTRPKERGRLVACRASCKEKARHRRWGFEVLEVVQITTIACQIGAAVL